MSVSLTSTRSTPNRAHRLHEDRRARHDTSPRPGAMTGSADRSRLVIDASSLRTVRRPRRVSQCDGCGRGRSDPGRARAPASVVAVPATATNVRASAPARRLRPRSAWPWPRSPAQRVPPARAGRDGMTLGQADAAHAGSRSHAPRVRVRARHELGRTAADVLHQERTIAPDRARAFRPGTTGRLPAHR